MKGGGGEGGNNSGMDLHPVQGWVIILPVASCEEARIKFKAQVLDGPLFNYPDAT